MAKFEIAEAITGINEGGYANNPKDKGGETYAGISRNNFPNWEGWKYIDRYKASYILSKESSVTKLSLAGWINASAKVPSEGMTKMISNFYKVNFWFVNRLDELKDQALANTVYDFGVNSGKNRGARFLQEAYNDLAGAVLSEDGKIGQKTISAVNAFPGQKNLYDRYIEKRRSFYVSIAVGDQAVWLKGWLKRLTPYKIYA